MLDRQLARQRLRDTCNCVVQATANVESRDLNSLFRVLSQRVGRNREFDSIGRGSCHGPGEYDEFLHFSNALRKKTAL